MGAEEGTDGAAPSSHGTPTGGEDEQGDQVVSILAEEAAVERLDIDRDGVIRNEEIDQAQARDRLDKELDRIRERRTGVKRRFPRDLADVVLISGLVIGVIYWGIIFATSSGAFLSDSIGADHNLSGTILDPGEKCVDNSQNIWINVWVDEEQRIRVGSHNVNDSLDAVMIVDLIREGSMEPSATEIDLESGSPSVIVTVNHRPAGEPPLMDGAYTLSIDLYDASGMNATLANLTNASHPLRSSLAGRELVDSIDAEAHIETRSLGSLFSEGTTEQTSEVEHDGARSCWTTQDLGRWGIALMLAEWGGGRETAMLAGGSAGVPPWWMAAVSLMMSVFFLFVQYPLMYRFYHRESDDILSHEQLSRLIHRTVGKTALKLHLEVESDEMQIREKDLSVLVYVPYVITHRSYSNPKEIKTAFIRDLLKEFAIFGEMRPLQLKSNPSNPHGGAADLLATGIDGAASPDVSMENPMLVDDYTSFFEDLNTYARIEDAVRDCLKDYFRRNDLKKSKGTVVMSDDHAVFVRVIYRSSKRLQFFREKKTHQEVQREIKEHITGNLEGLLGDRVVRVSASNEVQTLADRAAAGRVESQDAIKGLTEGQQAYVAKQEGIAGTLLQNQFVGDIISSIEFVAHENRQRIDRWGFFGLIVFVWIPFMASGVLVGAMLGLVARMRFERVLAACLIGGAAASITWAYTAQGIIEFMERYHAEAAIPVIIGIIVVLAALHVRTNKRRRKEALFKESMEFFRGEDRQDTAES